MATAFDRCSEYIDSIVDWTCIEKLPLERIVYGLAAFDFSWSLIVFIPTAMAHFLYVNPGGKSSFLHYKSVNFVDIYKYRRYQPWELEGTIDWNHELLYINRTRALLDKLCSRYGRSEGQPGDPGDYLKEVAGRPYSSGYNDRLSLIVRLLVATITLVYLSTPLLPLAVWWRKRRGRIIFTYIFIQFTPFVCLISVGVIISEELMCATKIAYGHAPIQKFFVVVSTVFAIYQIIKFFFLLLYVIERNLTHKRIDHGFPTKKIIRKTVRVPPTVARGRKFQVGPAVDEDFIEEYTKLFEEKEAISKNKKTADRMRSSSNLSVAH